MLHFLLGVELSFLECRRLLLGAVFPFAECLGCRFLFCGMPFFVKLAAPFQNVNFLPFAPRLPKRG
jgi:hypothetical protein